MRNEVHMTDTKQNQSLDRVTDLAAELATAELVSTGIRIRLNAEIQKQSEQGVTQLEIAKAAGISRQRVAQILEKGLA